MFTFLLFIFSLLTLEGISLGNRATPFLIILIIITFLFIYYRTKSLKLILGSLLYLILISLFLNYDFKFKIPSSSFLLKNCKNENLKDYLELFLFNQNKNLLLYQNSIKLGLTYLIVISGFHFHLFFRLLKKVINHFLNEYATFFICIGILFFYLVLLNFSISSSRAFLMLLIENINILFLKRKLKELDIFFLTLIIISYLFPLQIFSFSFIFSFTLTFFLLISKKIISLKGIRLHLYSFLVSLPLVAYLNKEINLFSFLYSYLLTYPFVSAICFSLLVLLFPFLKNLVLDYFLILTKLSSFLVKHSFYLSLNFKYLPLIFLYYFLFLSFLFAWKLKKKKKIYNISISLVIIVAFLFIFPYFHNPYKVTFLNVYQGDCIVFTNSLSKEAVMVDCGGNYKIDIAKEIIIPFLEKEGIKSISKIIITHDDYDHVGALPSLVKNFKVKEVLYSLKKLEIFNFIFTNLNNNQYNNKNDNSIVLYGKYNNYQLLLTGDISNIVEKDLIKNNPSLKVDILKVAHHGSKNSTSSEFLKAIKPNIAIISYGYNNYGHPSLEVIKRLQAENVKIYTTFNDGNITFGYDYKIFYIYKSKKENDAKK